MSRDWHVFSASLQRRANRKGAVRSARKPQKSQEIIYQIIDEAAINIPQVSRAIQA
jgi:hypothetical protein